MGSMYGGTGGPQYQTQRWGGVCLTSSLVLLQLLQVILSPRNEDVDVCQNPWPDQVIFIL